MRVDVWTIAADKLAEFVQNVDLSMVGYVRDTQNFIHLTAQSLTLFDVAPHKVERDLELWEPIGRWLDQR